MYGNPMMNPYSYMPYTNQFIPGSFSFHYPANPYNYIPDLYVKKKFKYDPFPPQFYFSKSHIPKIDIPRKLKYDKKWDRYPGMASPVYLKTKTRRMKKKDYDAMMAATALSPTAAMPFAPPFAQSMMMPY